MLRDLTIGQFYPVDSKIARLDPRVKMFAVIVYLVSLFIFDNFFGYAAATVYLFTVIYLSKVPLGYILRGIKPILFLLIFAAVYNLFATDGDIIFEWRFIRISWQGISVSIFVVMRFIYLIVGASMLTYTTTPTKMTDGIETALSPLEYLKIPVHDFAMMMSLALRFIPILVEESNRIINAQNSRCADFENRNLLKKIRALVSLLVPLLVSSMRKASDLSLAMEARCYHGGKNRTKMKPLKYRKSDFLAYAITLLYLATIICIAIFI